MKARTQIFGAQTNVISWIVADYRCNRPAAPSTADLDVNNSGFQSQCYRRPSNANSIILTFADALPQIANKSTSGTTAQPLSLDQF